jgi:uncharacterized membrane protein YfcA
MDLLTLLLLAILIFFVAALYSSVGHGGASGYLAALSLFSFSPAVMSTTALVLNVLVAGVGMLSFWKAGHLSLRKAWPFVVLSVPAAFGGGLVAISDTSYFFLLAAVLFFAAYRLTRPVARQDEQSELRPVHMPSAVGFGGGVGFISGVVGVGGGIFLSPLLIFLRWATTKQTAALSAFFIVVNSMAGLSGRWLRGSLEGEGMLPLIFAAFIGGVLGSYYGSHIFTGVILRRLLAVVLLIAGLKLLFQALA